MSGRHSIAAAVLVIGAICACKDSGTPAGAEIVRYDARATFSQETRDRLVVASERRHERAIDLELGGRVQVSWTV
ncbi:MAG: hypothetical protein AAFY60_06685, partial [Myxococcota bacterium]